MGGYNKKITYKQFRNKNEIARNSSIELLKIIAIIFVVLSHSIPADAIYSSAININYGLNFQIFVLQNIVNLGQIANCIFLVCSAWFLVDSKKAKGEKVATLFGDVFFEGIVTMIIAYIVGYRFSIKYTIKQLIPVIYDDAIWFVSCYILLYIVHPFLNIIIDKLDNRKLCSLAACLFVMYCCIFFVLNNAGFYYSNIIGFITIYFITAYVKRSGLYKKFMNKKSSIILIILCLLFQIAINLLSSYITAKTGKMLYYRWNAFINPLFILIALGSIGITLNKNYNNKIINYFSSLSLLIFIYHCNATMRNKMRFDFFQYILKNYSYTNLISWCFVFFIIILSYAVIASIIYKGVFKKYMDKISIEIYRKINIIWNKIINIINSKATS